ncbi:hemin ABC transporter ATP-binding protein [Boudabousia marimammalium]|uniref:Putative hemin import ATP-binding protein HrtA n=1 Tax=Boudabousia marimammalium TaxID=156892 RepID=A0A1Q5PKJ9_9ACTO|nr:hemin ABC transporter ATP-binding protein [Boudabousia marimammalium]
MIVKLDGVYKDFQQGSETIHALQPTDFQAREGEFIALIGPSGSGKSTMLTIIGGLQKPSGGTVQVGGQNLADLNESERAKVRLKTIGFVLQSSNLVPYLTVNEQLTLFDRAAKTRDTEGHTQADRDKLLASLGIEKLKDKHRSSLSGGEAQRAAIARALYGRPAVILADEPTASLDSKKAHEVAALLREQARAFNTCIIMVTHDERLINQVDTVYRMEDGVLQRS